MTDRELEGRIRAAAEHAAPDCLGQILSACGEQGGTAFPAPKKHPYRRAARLATAAVLTLVLAGAGVFGFRGWQGANAVDSVVMLDVNPSLAINVNAREKVLSVDALNDDAGTVLGGMELKGTQLNVAVNAIIGAMLRGGYLSDLQNAILVSVENGDADRSARLQAEVAGAIGEILSGGAVDGAVLSQTVPAADPGLAELAGTYGISLGKAALIREVVAQDATLTFSALAPMSVNEISLITSSKELDAGALTQTGTASDKAFIGQDAALEAAFTHAGISPADAAWVKAWFDSEDGLMVYEVEFYAGATEYEYDIDARTGEVVKYETEGRGIAGGPAGDGFGAPGGSLIGEDAAGRAALTHAGCAEGDAAGLGCRLSYDDGRPQHYEVEFYVDGTRYDYEISPYTGEVLKSGREAHHGDPSSSGAATGAAAYIGEDAAATAALSRAGVSAADAYDLEVELDRDHGHSRGAAVYEVEFKAGGMEYECEVDAVTGSILRWEQEAH